MNQYGTGMRNASGLARRICQIKGNRFLNGVRELVLDDTAFVPEIRGWTRLEGFRKTDEKAAGEALRRCAQQWIRASCRSGEASVFLMELDGDGALSVCYSNETADGIFRSNLPECRISHPADRNGEGYRCSGIVLGTLASSNIADTLASAGLRGAYTACIVAPVADSVAQEILSENRRLIARLTPYQSFRRVYGNASRRTVEIPVQEVTEAVSVMKEECEFLHERLAEGLVCAAVRFGARDRGTFLRLANLIQSGMTSHSALPGFEPVRCFELTGPFLNWRVCVSVPHIHAGEMRLPGHDAYAVSLQGIGDASSFCAAPLHAYRGYYVHCGEADGSAHDLFPAIPPVTGESIAVGRLRNSTGDCVLPLEGLLCHTAVFGATNTGKTNVVMKLLRDAWDKHQIPFVVLEAAKKEYNALLTEIPALRIFTPGVDGTPLGMNPLQPEDGVLIENHVAAVVQAISAATGAEHPIPEAFAGLLKRTYGRFGWEFGSMAYTDHTRPFPTFVDVCKDVDGYISDSARYGPEVRQNLTAALKLRCETYACGALGRLFANSSGLTAKDLLEQPTVIELSDLAEENTAFLMNLLLFRFQSFLERRPASRRLKRLIVVEEAHNVFRRTLSEDSALARSNQAFDKLFAEVRASGTGLILSDQRPSLMPDSVLANTAVKICLGMDSEEDRRSIGDTMGLSEAQRRELHTFQIGECLVTIRGHRGVFHARTERALRIGSLSAACVVCSCRFRCRKAAVEQLIVGLPQERVRYHLSKIAANPYNVSLLRTNIECMLEDMHVTATEATRLCLLGELLHRANIPLQESRLIVSAYKRRKENE